MTAAMRNEAPSGHRRVYELVLRGYLGHPGDLTHHMSNTSAEHARIFQQNYVIVGHGFNGNVIMSLPVVVVAAKYWVGGQRYQGHSNVRGIAFVEAVTSYQPDCSMLVLVVAASSDLEDGFRVHSARLELDLKLCTADVNPGVADSPARRKRGSRIFTAQSFHELSDLKHPRVNAETSRHTHHRDASDLYVHHHRHICSTDT
ncbi:hypothetical protein C8R44DRAFT_734686 [Mycena epipterygia]|nr:hypothetical protein C8R44DRAFT_734686 [Mycena epipterygia]